MEEMTLENKTITQALKAFYEKKDRLTLPFGHHRTFKIKDSYMQLKLIHPSKQHEGGDQFESSMTNQHTDESSETPIALDQLFTPMGSDREIKRLVISGRAGIGKSTLCNHLAYQWSQGAIFLDGKGRGLFDALFWLEFKKLKTDHKSIAEWIYESCFDAQTRNVNDEGKQEYLEMIRETLRGKRYLLLLDGFDEVSTLYTSYDDSRQQVIKDVLQFKQIAVTTRPYGLSTLMTDINFDRILENEGFAEESIKHYIHHYYKENEREGEELCEYIQHQPTLQTIAEIPLQTYFLCYSWPSIKAHAKKKQYQSFTLTELYRLFLREIWVRRLSSEEALQLQNFSRIENDEGHKPLLHCLAHVAYKFFTQDSGDIEFQKDELESFLNEISQTITIKQCDELGIIRKNHNQTFLFVHLTIQEFLTAYHLFLGFISPDSEHQNDAVNFVRRNKYHSRYQFVMTFLIGLIFRLEPNIHEKHQSLLWDCLFTVDVDWVGIRHIELLIRAVEESRDKDEENISQITQWIQSSLYKDRIAIHHTLRQRLKVQLAACPYTTTKCFERLTKELGGHNSPQALWDQLTNEQREAFLTDYWLPLISILSDDIVEFITELIAHADLSESLERILSTIKWNALKSSHRRSKLIEILQTKMQSADSSNSMWRITQVWLALLKEGDKLPEDVLHLIESKDDTWLNYAVKMARAQVTADMTLRDEMIDKFINLIKKDPDSVGRVISLLTTTQGWLHQCKKLIELWWEVLENKDDRLHQSAIVQLSDLLDQKSNEYAKLQNIMWQRRTLPVSESETPNVVLFQKEREEILIKALKHENWRISKAATKALGKWTSSVQPKEVIKHLTHALGHENVVICVAAIQTLSRVFPTHSNQFIDPILSTLKRLKIEAWLGRTTRKMANTLTMFTALHADKFIETLLTGLKDKNYLVIKILSEIPDDFVTQHANHIIEPLLNTLKDKDKDIDWTITRATVKVLSKFVPSHANKVIKPLLTYLKHEESFVRVAAVESLANIPVSQAKSVVKYFLAILLNHSEEYGWSSENEVRAAIYETLAKMPHSHTIYAIKPLLAALEKKDKKNIGDMNKSASYALAKLAHTHAEKLTEPLINIIKDENWYVRAAAINVIDELIPFHPDKLFLPLLEACIDNNYLISIPATEALKHFSPPYTEQLIESSALIDSLNEATHPSLRCALIKVIGNFVKWHAEILINPLCSAYSDENKDVRREVVIALGKIFPSYYIKIIAILFTALNDEDYEVRKSAIKILKHTPPHETRLVIDHLLHTFKNILEGDETVNTLSILVSPHDHYTINHLLDLLNVTNSEIRKRAAKTLIKLTKTKGANILPLFIERITFQSNDLERFMIIAAMPTLPLSFFMEIMNKAQCSKNDALLPPMLSIIGNAELKLTSPVDTININDDFGSNETLSQWATLLTQLNDSNQRIAIIKICREFHQKSPNKFFKLLFELLHQQLRIPQEITILCQMLNITSVQWIKALQKWKRPANWSHQITVLAALLYHDSASLMFTQGHFWLCVDGMQLQFNFLGDMSSLITQIAKHLQTLHLPHKRTMALAQRRLPEHVPESRYAFFPQYKDRIAIFGIQPLLTYQHIHTKERSQSCQKMISLLFALNKIIKRTEDYTISAYENAYQLKLKTPKAHELDTFQSALTHIFSIKDSPCTALDVSTNKLIDKHMTILSKYLKKNHQLRVLKLSHNQITFLGYSTLITMLAKNPSITYLLLDNNWITLDPEDCENLKTYTKKSGLVHLDLSLNYIPRGRLLKDDKLDSESSLEKVFGDQWELCKTTIEKDIVIHSACTKNQTSYLQNFHSSDEHSEVFEKINKEKGCVALMAYMEPTFNRVGTHSFLMIERIDPDFGQRQLILAELKYNTNTKKTFIRVKQLNPHSFEEHLKEIKIENSQVKGRIVFTDATNINSLLDRIFKTRDTSEFINYAVVPIKKGTANCHTTALDWLVKSDIIDETKRNEWTHINDNGGICNIL